MTVLWDLHVDLTGSRLGPGTHSVELVMETATNGPEVRAHLREITAAHYEIPLEQVGRPRRKRAIA